MEGAGRVVSELTSRGYNAEREAVTLLAGAEDPGRAIDRAVEAAPEEALVITTAHVRAALGEGTGEGGARVPAGGSASTAGEGSGGGERSARADAADATGATGTADGVGAIDASGPGPGDPPVSSGTDTAKSTDAGGVSPVETKGSRHAGGADAREQGRTHERDPSARSVTVSGDVTGESTGTGEYEDFVAVFRDRFERLAGKLRSRVNPRPTEAVREMPGGADAAVIGMVDDVRSTANGHWLVDLEDTTGTFPCLIMKDREFASAVETMLHDEVIAVEGTLADDGGILFVDSLHFPDVPRNHTPSTADRHVRAALVSDVHVGSQEFRADAWERFAEWLHTDEASPVEYLLIAGDMVEGVGVYPGQDEELDVVDIYEQYEQFSEHLKAVPGDVEIVMIPGNHDAVRLAEPQPGFDDQLRSIMSAHDARIHANPSTVTLEGVSFLLYHGVSLDELIAEFPDEEASYEHPHRAMYHLLEKRHVAPKYGGKLRLAPEDRDYLVIDEVPDVFHTGHVHKLGYGTYRDVLSVNSGCWQAQTAFQERVGIDPDVGFAPIVDLDTLDLEIRKFV